MPWLSDVIAAFTSKKADVEEVKQKIITGDGNTVLSEVELEAYVKDIETRVKRMTKNLRTIYSRYGITFNGFKSFNQAFAAIRASIKNGSEETYNNLIKTESSITSELKRHLSLIRMAVAQDGTKVIDKINQDPRIKDKFNMIFGQRDTASGQNKDGTYQRLWSEVHKLAEYIIIQKDKVYH